METETIKLLVRHASHHGWSSEFAGVIDGRPTARLERGTETMFVAFTPRGRWAKAEHHVAWGHVNRLGSLVKTMTAITRGEPAEVAIAANSGQGAQIHSLLESRHGVRPRTCQRRRASSKVG